MIIHKDVTTLTIAGDSKDGTLVVSYDKQPAICAGMVRPDLANLLSSAPYLYNSHASGIDTLKALIPILENEGLDRAAAIVLETISAMEFTQKFALEGVSMLTASKPVAK